jgi:hypothetical protein
MKKFLIALNFIIWATVAVEAQAEVVNLDVTMADGQHKVYTNIDGDTDLTVIKAMIEQDFGTQQIASAVVNKQPGQQLAQQEQPQTSKQEEAFCSSTLCRVAVGVAVVAALGYGINALSKGSSGNSCDYSWQTAKDGSRCGNRAANVRPGGRI